MKRLSLLLAALLLLSGCAAPAPEPEAPPAPPLVEVYIPDVPEPPAPPESPAPPVEPELPEPPADPAAFVRVRDYIPDILVELRYAGADNFTGQVIYGFSGAYLRYGTVKKLAAVQSVLAEEGLCLKIWDAFRPPAAQFRLWEACPDSRYVANPNKGFSSHSRGNTVDLTLVDGAGEELEMPTGFDDFSARADRDYGDVSAAAAENARRLEEAMSAQGFIPYSGEWWHYTDEEPYPVEEQFTPPAGEDAHGGNPD